MADSNKQKDVVSSLSKLSLDQTSTKAKTPKSKVPVVADSWEDEDISSGSDREEEAPEEVSRKATQSPPSAPSATTLPTSYGNKADQSWPTPGGPSTGTARATPGAAELRRPEKTDAVARRMIAGALGIKAPKLTDEQKAYDRAIRQQAKTKREEEKAAERKRQEEAEKAKAAIWGD